MTEKKIYIGSVGPFIFDDTDLIDDEDGDFAGDTMKSIVTNHQMQITDPPADDEHIVRLEDMDGRIFSATSVADIDDPSTELGALASVNGSILMCYEVSANENEWTMYLFDSAVGTGVNIPYAVAGSSGFWVAVAGKYVFNDLIIDRDLIFTGAGKGLSFGSLCLHEGALNIDISAVGQGVHVKITGLTQGLLNNVTINSDAFRVANVGIYKIDWQISGDSQGNNKDYEVDIFVNSVEQVDGSARREFANVASLGSMSGTGFIDVTSVSHDIDLRIKELGGGAGTDFDIFNLNFNILQIGGT